MAVTREGIPVKVWTFPGNASDQVLIRTVKDDLRSWNLNRVIWVLDRGFTSEKNRRYLQRGGGHYIVGEKLRGDAKEAAAALGRQGRYHAVAGNLRVKEVRLDDRVARDRFVICHNPDRAARDAEVRSQILERLGARIAGSDELGTKKRAELAGALRRKPAFARFLRETPTGKLRIDRAKVARDAHLDGKFLLRSSDESLSASDIAEGYKGLYEAERGWRDPQRAPHRDRRGTTSRSATEALGPPVPATSRRWSRCLTRTGRQVRNCESPPMTQRAKLVVCRPSPRRESRSAPGW
jgi:hypothetical protein